MKWGGKYVFLVCEMYFFGMHMLIVTKRGYKEEALTIFYSGWPLKSRNKVYKKKSRYSDDPLGNGWNVKEAEIAYRRVQRRSPIPKGPRRVRLAPLLTSPGTKTQLNFKMICAILALDVRRPPIAILRVFRDFPLSHR